MPDRVPAGDKSDKPVRHLAALVQDCVDRVGDHVHSSTELGTLTFVKDH